MGKQAGKHKKYVDSTRNRSQLTCLINGPQNHSYECKVLHYFGNKYDKYRPFK